MELKQNVIRGMAWGIVERAGSMLLQMGVSLVIARLLSPEDYGLIAILVVFTTICSIFVESGYTQALIRKQDLSKRDFSSVFAFNFSLSVGLYLLLLLLSPVIAWYFESAALLRIAPVLFLLLPINALCSIQSAMFVCNLDFRRLAKYTLWSSFVASVISVGLAIAGAGVWALVAQRLLTVGVKALLLWIVGEWRPTREVSTEPLKSMFKYSSRLFLSDFVSALYFNISQLFIGKMYTPVQLGYYEQGRKLKEMPVTSVIGTVQNVTFSALSKLQDNPDKFCDGTRKVTMVLNWLMFPVMVGLIAIAKDMFLVLLTEKWLPTVPYFQIFCLGGVFVPLSVVSYSVMKIKSDGSLILRMEIVKKVLATIVLCVTIPISVRAIVWGQTIIFLCDMVVNMFGAGRCSLLNPWRQLAASFPYAVMALVMWGGVYGVGWLLQDVIPEWALLLVKILCGAAIYMGETLILKPEGWKEVNIILKEYASVRNGGR